MVPTNFTGTINDNRMDLATDTTWIYEVSVSSVVGENSIILNLKGGTREPPDPFCSGLIAQVFVSKVPKNVQEHESQYSGNIGPPSKVPAILEPPFSSSSPVKRKSSPVKRNSSPVKRNSSPVKRTKFDSFVPLKFKGDWSPNDGNQY